MNREERQQILGYLKRPRLYPELLRIARWRLLGRRPEPDERRRAEAWCEERAVRTAEAIARLTGAPMPQSVREKFPEVFAEAERVARACPARMGGPGDVDLLYWLAEHLRAARVIETGVAYGWSSLALLLSLAGREGARLVSTDMPYTARDNEPFVGVVVPESLRHAWQIIPLADGEALPRALRILPEVDLCHYDSSKRYAARRWAYPLLWKAVRPGGFFVSDDIGDNLAYRDFCAELGIGPVVVRHGDETPGAQRWYVGVLVEAGERMIRRALNRLLLPAGLALERAGHQGWSPAHLRRFGFAPRTLVDVGVGTGTPALYAAFPEAELVLLEPLAEFEPDLRRILSGRKGRYLLTAVGAAVEDREIHVEPGNRLKSSLLGRTSLTATGDRLEHRSVPVTTLDRLLGECGFTAPFGLKIDTEGFELDVVRGATRFLEQALFVIAEVSLAPRFEGGYGFAEFVGAMAERGFRACDVLEVARSARSPEASYLDLVFRRERAAPQSADAG